MNAFIAFNVPGVMLGSTHLLLNKIKITLSKVVVGYRTWKIVA